MEDDDRFRTNRYRVRHRQALDDAIARVFSELTSDELVARLESSGIANAKLGSIGGFPEHPQLRARDRWREIDSPAGPLRALLPPVQIDGVEAAMGAVPSLGQHTDAILAELGYGADLIAEWRREGAI